MNTRQLLLTLAVALAGGFAAGWLQSPASAQEPEKIPALVRAQRFELVDDKGRVRAHLHAEGGVTELLLLGDNEKAAALIRVQKDGLVALSLSNDKTKPQTMVHASPDNRGIAVFDDKGQARATLHTSPVGIAVLRMNYADNKIAAMLTTQDADKAALLYLQSPQNESAAIVGNKEGRPVFLLQDGNIKERVKLTLLDGDVPAISLHDAKAAPRLMASVAKEGWAGVSILDPKGRIRSEHACDGNGDTRFVIWDSNKRNRVLMRVDGEDKVKLELADENGKSLFKQPKD